MNKVKHQFEMVVAVEYTHAHQELFPDVDPIEEDNGKLYFPLGQMRAGVLVSDDEDLSDAEIQRKAVRTACHWWKVNNPEWADTLLYGLGVELCSRTLVR